jgi:hypothetical protein
MNTRQSVVGKRLAIKAQDCSSVQGVRPNVALSQAMRGVVILLSGSALQQRSL